jgi:hypothetical protein
VRYCVQRFDHNRNPDILYYFNGALADHVADKAAEMGQTSLIPLIDTWKDLGLAPPTIVTVSWGGRWLLRGARVTALEAEVIPKIEASLTARAGGRLLVGSSMGGLNAYLAWKRLPHLFAKAAFQCPAFISFNPVTDSQTRRKIAERMTPIEWRRPWRHQRSLQLHFDALTTLAWAFEKDVTSGSGWSEFDPAAMVRDGIDRPPAYVVFNSGDQFGLQPGYELAKAGYRVTYEQVADSHCGGVNTTGLARFLSRRSSGGAR